MATAIRPGQDDDRRQEDLRVRGDQRRPPRGRQVPGRQGALHLGEVRRPVAEADDEAEAEHHPDPVRLQRVGLMVDAEALPGVQAGVAERGKRLDPVLEPGPAAHRVQRHQRERYQRGADHEELEHLVVDRRGQAAERDVDEHDRRGGQDRAADGPAEQQVDDQGQREQVDAADQHGGDGERERVEDVRGIAETEPQVLGHRADLGPVVERHQHQPEEHHRGHRADPVVVNGRDAVLGAVGGLAEDLERAQVRGDERQARDPCRQRAPGQEEVEIGLDRQPGDEPDAEHHREVDRDDHVIDRAGMQSQHGLLLSQTSTPAQAPLNHPYRFFAAASSSGPPQASRGRGSLDLARRLPRA